MVVQQRLPAILQAAAESLEPEENKASLAQDLLKDIMKKESTPEQGNSLSDNMKTRRGLLSEVFAYALVISTYEKVVAESSGLQTTDAKSTTDQLWIESHNKLLEFREKYGHSLVPEVLEEDLSLGMWVNHQRKWKEDYCGPIARNV